MCLKTDLKVRRRKEDADIALRNAQVNRKHGRSEVLPLPRHGVIGIEAKVQAVEADTPLLPASQQSTKNQTKATRKWYKPFSRKNRKTNSSSDVGSTRSSRDSGPLEPIQATQRVPGAQNVENRITPSVQNSPNALHIAGAVVEKGLEVLKEIADLVPVVPAGVGSALGVVSKCIQIYHQVSENKERTEALAKDLASKVKDVKKYRSESGSTETDGIFENLASELEKINIKAAPQKYETWTSKMLGNIQQVAQADGLSQEINQYFQDKYNSNQ
ncbi:hypothetical protein BDP27DRAFT_1370997 [Rhodocollybia butyracea]|uniref:Uncharacterized protein n=1 Tax=Rhodocollybia butyracea TaxID=206335 RepID=A0A9P5P6Q5_9AGAR|nr:hypothetical protein BDP27DRAFT_1370997 [Rhodocollybia butyracea]